MLAHSSVKHCVKEKFSNYTIKDTQNLFLNVHKIQES